MRLQLCRPDRDVERDIYRERQNFRKSQDRGTEFCIYILFLWTHKDELFSFFEEGCKGAISYFKIFLGLLCLYL